MKNAFLHRQQALPGLRRGALCRLALALVLAGTALLPATFAAHAQDEPRVVTLLEPVQGTLSDRVPAHDWAFEGRAGQTISILVRTVEGDLDPVLTVFGPDDEPLGENDDRDSLVTDAGLEALSLPDDGTYTLRVGRYEGEAGTTTGTYELQVTPGYGRVQRTETFEGETSPWLVPGRDLVSLADGRLRLRAFRSGGQIVALPSVAEPVADFYLQAEAELAGVQSYAEFGLAFRAARLESGRVQGYQFRVNTEGRWTVLREDPTGVYVLKSWTPNEALDTTDWTLAVMARGSSFTFWGNGVLLGSVSDSTLSDPGAFGLVAATRAEQLDPATVLFDDLLLTTRQVTTYRGLPLTLSTWDSRDPRRIAEELAASGELAIAPTRDLFVPQLADRTLQEGAFFNFIGASGVTYTDFIFGATFNIVSNGESVACGLTFRWQDERNLSVAYVDTVGGFGLAQTVDAELVGNVYDLSPMVTEDSNVLFVVARGERVGLYVNGALVAEEAFEPGAGRVGTALLNYEPVGTDCYFLDLWVWPLVEEPSGDGDG